MAAGELVALLGSNGAGKTTFNAVLSGLVKARSGQVHFDGQDLTGRSCTEVVQAGLIQVPEGRKIFPNLTVRENLLMAFIDRGWGGGERWTIERVIDFFPRLGERLGNAGNQLSGGEQQMLAIGRALMTNPRLLVLDEATEGLAPVIREEIWARLGALKKTGLSILVIDKEIEALEDGFARAATLDERKAIAEKIQLRAVEFVPYVPVMQTATWMAHRSVIRNLVAAPIIPYWGLEKVE